MKNIPLLRPVPKPLRPFQIFRRAVAPPPLTGAPAKIRRREVYESVRYIPVWMGTQLMPFPLVTRSRRERGDHPED